VRTSSFSLFASLVAVPSLALSFGVVEGDRGSDDVAVLPDLIPSEIVELDVLLPLEPAKDDAADDAGVGGDDAVDLARCCVLSMALKLAIKSSKRDESSVVVDSS
jgi:hypothetical protein